MKKLIAIVFGALLATSVSAEEFSKSLDAAPDGRVDISNIAGSVAVNGWSRNQVEVSGTLGRNVKELVFERDGNRVTIKVKVPRNGGHGISSELVVNVPEGSSIDVSTVSAEITVKNVLGEQSLQSVSGDVTTEAMESNVTAASVSGDVEVTGTQKDTYTKVGTVSGDVTLFRVSGEVAAEAVSGDVTIDEGSFSRATLNTVNGEILFHAALRKGGRLQGETVNGEIDVELAGNVSATFDVETFNGSIKNCFGPKAERTSKYAPGWELRFSEGEGEARVELATMNGGIRICQD